MHPDTRDEGWVPAIKGLFTWCVWRPGRSSAIARLRAKWLLFLAGALLIVVAVSFIEDDGVLRRWVVYIGWASFVIFPFLAVFLNVRLKAGVLAAPPERIAEVFGSRWLRATFMALMPMILAGSLARASDPGVVRYPIYWGVAVTLPMLVMMVPSVGRVRRLDQERAAVDGASVVTALSAPTVKIDR